MKESETQDLEYFRNQLRPETLENLQNLDLAGNSNAIEGLALFLSAMGIRVNPVIQDVSPQGLDTMITNTRARVSYDVPSFLKPRTDERDKKATNQLPSFLRLALSVQIDRTQFPQLNKKSALELIETGKIRSLVHNLEQFSELDEEIALKLIDMNEGEALIRNLKHFSHLDEEVALKLIDAGEEYNVVLNINTFEGVNHKKIALQIIKKGTGKIAQAFLEGSLEPNENPLQLLENFINLENLRDLDMEVALKLIDAMNMITHGEMNIILNIKSFSKEHHEKIALQLIEKRRGKALAQNLKKFQKLDHKKIAMKLIEAEQGDAVTENLEQFPGVNHREIALKLIETGQGNAVIQNLKNAELKGMFVIMRDEEENYSSHEFLGLDQEIAVKLIEARQGEGVLLTLKKFQKLDHKELILKLIETEQIYALTTHFAVFSNLDQDTALSLVDAGQREIVFGNLQSFSELDNTALRLVDAGQGEIVSSNLQSFSKLDNTALVLRNIQRQIKGIGMLFYKFIKKH